MAEQDSGPTVFGKIIRKEIPASILYEDDQLIVFKDINPVADTHFLVVPKKYIKKFDELGAEDGALVSHMMCTAARVAKEQGLEDGYRLVINNGPKGGQEVYHLHLHVIGGRQMSWPPG